MSASFFQQQYSTQVASTFLGSKSIFTPRIPEKVAPVIGEFYQVQFKEAGAYTPSESAFTLHSEPPYNGNLLGEVWLKFTVSAITDVTTPFAAGAGDVMCFHDDLAYAAIEEIRLVDGGEVVERVKMREEHLRQCYEDIDERRNTLDLRGWYGSEAACNAAARSAKTYYVKLPFEFCKDYFKYLRLIALRSNQLSFELKMAPKSEWTYASGFTPVFTFTDYVLWIEYFTLGQSELSALMSRSLSYPYKMIETLSEMTVSHTTGTDTTSDLEIPFLHPVSCIYVLTQASDHNSYRKKFYSEPDTAVSKGGIKADGKWRWEEMDSVWWMKIYPARVAYRADNNLLVFPATYAMNNPTETGFLDCSKLQNVYLRHRIASARGTATFKVLVFAQVPNVFTYTTVGSGTKIRSLYDR